MTVFTMTPKEVRQGIIDCLMAGIVPYVASSPGMGKSAIYASIAKEFNLELIDVRLSQCAPEDLMGLPMRSGEGADARASFIPFSIFPLAGDPLPEGKDGWLLLFDELPSAPKSVQAASYKVMLDRYIGMSPLHDNCFVGAAGNKMTDKAIVNSLSTAMQSRLVHMEMEVSHSDFMDFAVQAGWDSRLLAFLEFRPRLLHSFDPDHTDRTFPCPRTWEFVNRLIKGKPMEAISLKLLAGAVGDGAATEFHAYLKVFSQLPSYNAICVDPENAPLPRDAGARYGVISMMIDKFDHASFKDAGTYAKRFDPEFQVIYFRGIKRRDPKFIKNPDFIKLRKDLTNFITGDDLKAAA